MDDRTIADLVPRAVFEAYTRVRPLPRDEMPTGREARRLRTAGGLSRDVVAVLSGVSASALADYEANTTSHSRALRTSTVYRRLMAACRTLVEEAGVRV